MLLYRELTETIIGCFYKVYNTLGYGFLEQVYENALALELSKNSLQTKKQHPIDVYYEDIIVGKYFADILVNDVIILELKTDDTINKAHEAQLINYLKATGKQLGLILYFGKEAKFRRIIANELAKKYTVSVHRTDRNGTKQSNYTKYK